MKFFYVVQMFLEENDLNPNSTFFSLRNEGFVPELPLA